MGDKPRKLADERKYKKYEFTAVRNCIVCHQPILNPTAGNQNTHEGECRRLRAVRMSRAYRKSAEPVKKVTFPSVLQSFIKHHPSTSQEILKDEVVPNYGLCRDIESQSPVDNHSSYVSSRLPRSSQQTEYA